MTFDTDMNGIFEDLRNTFRRQNNALMQIIVINLMVFVFLNLLYVILHLTYGRAASASLFGYFSSFITLPSTLRELVFRPWTFVTYFFAHVDFFHILGNLLFLYWFGKVIEEYLGSKRVTSLYVLGGLAGGVAFMLFYPLLPDYRGAALIGASAGVSAMVVGAATLTPNYIFHLFLLGPVPIKYIALFQVLFFVFGLRGMNPGGEIAHLGGALIGYIYVIQLQKGNDWGKWIHNFLGLFKRRSKMKATYVSKTKVTVGSTHNAANSRNTASETPDQAEIDAILDKISATGYESLTKEEKQKLFKASKH
ncbi:MAG: rhomboid family intramembrane serine protease [Microscillaceae bacterium]|nr:rhomboid family intramembrane serine protease [Microscillaceae bacterium]